MLLICKSDKKTTIVWVQLFIFDPVKPFKHYNVKGERLQMFDNI